ncbi:deoxyribodipyrimidine photo-lyase [Rhodococcus sp. D2-41]|uniref:DNA photolyase family protein n=1 Tax=Speluncibacter jeojiensis TaxID=2710754 RepID=A0A9X4RCG5_9ACTN|nr:deoxyribodipyrimidine photo-lyase [Rhodococcus sp. D2-41]MDG3010833.1 deoxyribodipyrimidine photo-lyase [Rhodococcus sp. D2-41]MDG3013805.1 DNA photolyase family protein [Corynebacteriales bacterium D3-21]
MTVAIALFTRDLRVHDNPGLAAAVHRASEVVPLFVLDDAIAASGFNAPNRARFLSVALTDLDGELRRRGGRLVVRRGSVVDEVVRVAVDTGATEVHIAADVSGYSRRREQRLRQRLRPLGCALHVHAGSITVADAGELRPSTGRDHFAVFTPYHRRWREWPLRRPLPPPPRIRVPRVGGESLPSAESVCAGSASPQLRVGGEQAGQALLRRWLDGPIRHYHERSDDLGADATSHLSPYLHFGCVSATEILARLDHTDPGAEAFARQLCWRDFHHQVLSARPDVAVADYRPRERHWITDERIVQAWRDGRTGYPIVDAGMRQLAAQGWMPGRARLIAASVLTKTLRVDWRIGAAHFAHWLVDGDIANNQLNWQWAAGTGTDTRPNRTLNPLRQAERFDPLGDYVRRWIPELAHLVGKDIHRPGQHAVPASVYPGPVTAHLHADEQGLFELFPALA